MPDAVAERETCALYHEFPAIRKLFKINSFLTELKKYAKITGTEARWLGEDIRKAHAVPPSVPALRAISLQYRYYILRDRNFLLFF